MSGFTVAEICTKLDIGTMLLNDLAIPRFNQDMKMLVFKQFRIRSTINNVKQYSYILEVCLPISFSDIQVVIIKFTTTADMVTKREVVEGKCSVQNRWSLFALNPFTIIASCSGNSLHSH